MNVYQKINEVMKRIEYLTKDDQVNFGTTRYKAISEEKVTTAVRNELVKVGLVIIPIKQDINVVELMRSEKSVNQRTDVNVVYRIQNIDDSEDYIEASSSGSGVDTQDKGVGKAMTYAYKYLLLRTFAIPTGEDPDKISSAETDEKMAKEIEGLATKRIGTREIDILKKTIQKYNVSEETLEKILAKYNYTHLEDITMDNYAKIGNEMSK